MNSLAIPSISEELASSKFSEQYLHQEINFFNTAYTNQNTFLNYIWEQFLVLFEKEKGKKAINNWLKSLEILNWNNQKKIISIHTPNGFIKSWIETHFLTIIEKIFARLLNEKHITIQFIIGLKNADNQNKTTETIKNQKLSDISFLLEQKNIKKNRYNIDNFFDQYINSIYNIEHFLITKSNETVISAIQYFIEKDDSWNTILFIYGDNAIGKTHLLQGIRSLCLQKNILTAYINAEIFLRQYIEAAKKKSINEFEQKFQNIDLLIIDDIEHLKSKPYTQEFLIKIINDFNLERKKIIFSGKQIPKNILGLSQMLCNKIEQGLIFHFETLSKEDIKNILLLKIKINNYSIPENIFDYILNIENITINQGENILHKIMAESIITKKPLSIELLNNTIKDINIKDKKNILFNKNTDIDDIMKRISQETNMTIDQIKKNRKKEQIKIKYLSIYILRTIMKFSCHEVSIYFEYKDHTTLSYACKIFELNYKETDEMKKILSLFT